MSTLAQSRSRARRKAQELDDEDLDSSQSPHFITFGMYGHRKLTVAELVFVNPSYFFWCISQGVFKKYLGYEAWRVAERVSHIRPPRKVRDNFRFDCIFDSRNRLINYAIVRSESRLTKSANVSHKVIRVKHLDLSLLCYRDPDVDPACEKLLKKIRKDVLPSGRLGWREFQDFINDEKNFDLSCRETHCPLVPRLKKNRVNGLGE